MSKEIKNMFPALSAVLKANKISLEKEEFKVVLDIINGKDINHSISLSPIAGLIIRIFDEPELKDNEVYMVEQKGDYLTETSDAFAIAKNRSQLLKIVLNPQMIFPEITVKTFGMIY